MTPPDDIRDFLRYDQETGVFRWIIYPQGVILRQDGVASCIHKRKGYRYICFRNHKYAAHHLAWWFVYGKVPHEIDHIHGVEAGDGIANLRVATHSQNISNSRISCKNTSGFRGVRLNKRNHRWQARIGVSGQVIYLGEFDSIEDAARAYDVAALEFFVEFARPNFPLEH
jgi:hypothetical protein